MPRRKPGLSLERHREIGRILKEMDQQLASLAVEFGNAYPKTGERSLPHQHLLKARAALSEARNRAENNCAKEFPDDWEVGFYYGREA